MIKKGFTLAEVLVTLGIIGVVSALTIPQLSSRTANAQLGPQYAKAISSLENAIGTFFYEYNVKNVTQLNTDDLADTKISTLLAKLNEENYLKMTSGISSGPCSSGYMLADKSVICVRSGADCELSVHNGKEECEIIFVSSKAANLGSTINGLDYFKMSLSADGLIYVPGADYTPKDNTCGKKSGGGACAGRVAKNGWKFSDAVFDETISDRANKKKAEEEKKEEEKKTTE